MRRLLYCCLLLAPAVNAPPAARAQTPQAQLAQAQMAQAQTAPAQTAPAPDTDAVRRSLGEMLSFASFGMIPTLGPDSEVVRDGDSYRVRLPLAGLAANGAAAAGKSADAVTALARPAADGTWDIQSLTFPSTASIRNPGLSTGLMTYTIGQQAITAHIDPSLKQPSSYDVRMRDIRLDTEHGQQTSRHAVGTYAVHGSVTGAEDGRVNLSSIGEMTDWSMSSRIGDAVAFDMLAQRVGVNGVVRGLDRAKGQSLREHLRALLADLPRNGQPPGPAAMDPAASVSALLNDMIGLVSRFQIDETLEGVRIHGREGMDATLGSVIIRLNGGAEDQALDAALDLAINDLNVLSAPAVYAVYTPRHITVRNRVKNLPSDSVVALLRAALAPDADQAALQAQALRVLSTPGSVVSIDPFSFDSGPLNVSGTALLVPRPDGRFAGHFHVVASGVDALIAQVQHQPELAQVVPILFIAKGMGKPDGGNTVWDIDLDQNGVKINGTPFGQPKAPPPQATSPQATSPKVVTPRSNR